MGPRTKIEGKTMEIARTTREDQVAKEIDIRTDKSERKGKTGGGIYCCLDVDDVDVVSTPDSRLTRYTSRLYNFFPARDSPDVAPTFLSFSLRPFIISLR